MKFTDEQKDLLAFLPKALKNSKELTDSSKLVLGNIIFLYGMEDAQKNGYVFRSYDDLMKDTFIKSKTSISRAIALLVQKEYIKVKSGRLKERKANEFTLLNGTLLNKKCTEKCTEKCTLTDYWTNKIESLENEIVLLKKEIEELKKCTEKCTTETDTEIEKDIYTTCSNSTCMEKDNIKEKSNKKEMDYRDNGSMGVSPSDERDESFWEFYNSLEDGDDLDESQMAEVKKNRKENEVKYIGMNGMNANRKGVKRNESITSTYGNKDNTSTVVNENRSTSTESMKIYTATAAQTETEKKRESLLKNIEDGKRFMYEASKMKDLNVWCAQKDYLKIQFNNLKQITSPEAYKSEVQKFNNWWNATKHCFPNGWNEKQKEQTAPKHQRIMQSTIETAQVSTMKHWVDILTNAETQEEKDNAQEMIERLLSIWQDKYDADSITKVCQECHLKASGEHQTAKVEQLPTQHKTMQYKPQEEECGDFASEDLKIYCINTPSVQVAN